MGKTISKITNNKKGMAQDVQRMRKIDYLLKRIEEVEMLSKKGDQKYVYRLYEHDENSDFQGIPDSIPVQIVSYDELKNICGKKDAATLRRMCLENWPKTKELAEDLIQRVGVVE